MKIYLNVIRKSDGTGGRTWASINAAVQSMVDAFIPMGILFSIEGRDSIENTTIYNYSYFYFSGGALFANGAQIQGLYQERNHANAIDIYFAPSITAGASFAEGPTTPSDPAIVLGSTAPQTLIHEMGHIFGLMHTFGMCNDDENCVPTSTICNCGDFISDTSYDTQQSNELADTTEIDLAKIRTWLRNKESIASEYAIVESWMEEGDTTTALAVLDSVLIRFDPSVDDSLRHLIYKDWVELRIDFIEEDKDLYDLDSVDVELVEDIAEADSVGLAAAQSRGLLNALYDYDYRLHPKQFSTGGLGIMAPPSNGNVAVSQALVTEQITAFPNPAKDLVKFRYKVTDQEPAWLTIHDMNGRFVAKFALLTNETEVVWKTDGLASGVYYYKATVLDNVPQKLVLIK